MIATAPTSWKDIKAVNFSFAEHNKQKFGSAHHALNHWFVRYFGRTDIPHYITSLQGHDTIIDQIRQIFLNGLIDITGGNVDLAAGFASVFAPLDMTYIKDNHRYVLDTDNKLESLLYCAGGFVDIELDINSLHFKDNFNAFDFRNISFASFTTMIQSEETSIRRHANALRMATADAVTRRSAAALAEAELVFLQTAETATISNVNSIQNHDQTGDVARNSFS